MSRDISEMSGYIQEKALNSLRWTTNIVEFLKRSQGSVPPELLSELTDNVRNALHDLTKVVASLVGPAQKQRWDDVDVILEKGERGLDEVLYKYGYIPEPDHMRRERERPQLIASVLKLSKGEMRGARRAIYYECERFGHDPLVTRIRDLLEGVTQGTKTWSQFQQETEQLLSPNVVAVSI